MHHYCFSSEVCVFMLCLALPVFKSATPLSNMYRVFSPLGSCHLPAPILLVLFCVSLFSSILVAKGRTHLGQSPVLFVVIYIMDTGNFLSSTTRFEFDEFIVYSAFFNSVITNKDWSIVTSRLGKSIVYQSDARYCYYAHHCHII